MILIKLTDSFVANNSIASTNPKSFILHLGDDDFVIPSNSRHNLTSISIEDAVRNGSPYQINLRPYETFEIDDEVFENLVTSSKAGGDTVMVNRLLHFVSAGVIEVWKQGSAPMTAKQLLNFTA